MSDPGSVLDAAALGIVLDLHFLAPDVFLDRPGVGHDVLADAHLFP